MNHRSKTFSFYFFVHGQSLYGKERLDSALFPPKEAIEDWILKIQEEDTFEDYKNFFQGSIYLLRNECNKSQK